MSWFSDNETLVQAALAMTLLAFSLQVCMRAGIASFAGVGLWAIGGYTTAVLVHHGWRSLFALLAAVALSVVVAVALGLALGRLHSLYLAMATISFVLLVQIVARVWDGVTGGAEGLYGIPVTLSTGWMVAFVAAGCAVVWALGRGRSGRTAEALRVDEPLAPSLGIDVRRQRLAAFALSGVFGALAGGANALLFNALSPDQFGFALIVDVLTVLVIGGVHSWIGPLIGAIVVTWLPTWLSFLGSARPEVQGAVVVLIAVWLPDGIVGVVRRGAAGVGSGLRRPGLRRLRVGRVRS
jgi:branched-chain amino acid transport system permease protein